MAASPLHNFQDLVAWLRDNVRAPEQFTLSYSARQK